jgi:hypothetical protein
MATENIGLALEAGVDDDKAVLDAYHLGGDDFAGAHLAALEAFLEQGGKGFAAARMAGGGLGLGHVVSWRRRNRAVRCRQTCHSRGG